KWKVVFATLPLMLFMFYSAHAQQMTDEDMAGAALISLLRTADPNYISESIRDSRQAIQQEHRRMQSSDVPYGVRMAFSRGLTADELGGFVDNYGLELVRAEAKFPVETSGNVFTVSIGM